MSYHFADSTGKLNAGESLYTICGLLILKPEFKARIGHCDASLLLALRTQLRDLCRECRVLPLTEEFRYVVCGEQQAIGKGHSA